MNIADLFDGREQWTENWLLYERGLMIQEDLEWLAEAVYQFYQKYLDNLIRENDRMWGDFCKERYDDDGHELGRNSAGYDMTETHFSFSTKLMVWQLTCTNMKL